MAIVVDIIFDADLQFKDVRMHMEPFSQTGCVDGNGKSNAIFPFSLETIND